MDNHYLVYTELEPHPDHAANLRQMWAAVRKQNRNRDFRRRLAHDYAVARCAAKKEAQRGRG